MYNPQLETFIRVADAGSFNKAAEIGRMMGAPSNTVLSWLRRARAQLHTMLKEEIEDEVV